MNNLSLITTQVSQYSDIQILTHLIIVATIYTIIMIIVIYFLKKKLDEWRDKIREENKLKGDKDDI